jgi:lipoprotein-anchoring transpeptidase ErfK/SrfK
MSKTTTRRFFLAAGAAGLAGPAAAQIDPYYGRPYGSPRGYGYDPYGEGEPDPYADPYGRRRAPARGAQPEPQPGGQPREVARVGGEVDYDRAYAALDGEPFPVAAFRWRRMNPAFLRQPVAYSGGEAPGTVIVDPRARQLMLVYGGGTAMRYGVGVGRQGFAWAGQADIRSKQAWPDWYPPKEMIDRQPDLKRQLSQLQSGIGVHGGPRNPLGARAMYLWQGNKDTLYRIHGTLEPETIGTSVSSGCIRMINQDAVDLYNRVQVGSRVVVLG